DDRERALLVEARGVAILAFLASPHAAYITGSTFHVDGGRRASLL
ncbi:MAG: hypothetical protein HYU44_02720, partial [Betaproteobacteria bacterium]|nr:hypothetical protein [Betaproteobacteria bacterium]